MLKAITFDLWQTLITETPEGSRWTKVERIRRLEEVLHKRKVLISREGMARAYEEQREQLEELWKTHRDIGAREQVAMLLDILQVGESARHSDFLFDPLIDAYTLPILSGMPVLREGALEIVRTFESRGFRLAVICNTGRTPGNILRIILERLDISKSLSVQTYSDEVGWRKPHPNIFERALSELGVAPAETLHVGDSLESDITGARNVGMRAVHLCHMKGASPHPGDAETIFSLNELLGIID